MASEFVQREHALLSLIVPGLEADGYTVFVRPMRSLLPQFMRDQFRPDAIALRSNKKLAIQVNGGRVDEPSSVERVRRLFADHPDWDLRVFYAPDLLAGTEIAPSDRQTIEGELRKVRAICDAAGATAALLTAWSALEAAARFALPDDLGLQQPPQQLVERLAFHGLLSPDEEHEARRLAVLRNRAAHGDLEAAMVADVTRLTELVAAVFDNIGWAEA